MKKFGVLIICLSAWSVVHGQDWIAGKGVFQIDIDFARFSADSTLSYLEMYYAIRENMLAYRQDAGGYTGAVVMKWKIARDTVTVASKEWSVPHTVKDTVQLARNQSLMGLESVGLPPGDYTMSVVTYDVVDSTRRDSVLIPLKVDVYPRDREALSDIEFCTSIQSAKDRQSIFYKNTLEVIPNASRLYGTGLPIMYYYVEAYNLQDGGSNDPHFVVRTAVIDALGSEVITKDKTKPRQHNSSAEVGTVNLSALRGGTYTFRVTLMDTSKRPTVSVSKKFFVYRPGTQPDTTLGTVAGFIGRDEFAAMSMPEVDEAFARARYIASDKEREQYEKLTDVRAKQKFMTEFWYRRDPDPVSPINEYREEYSKRVAYAAEQYTWGSRKGWQTDRGRVYIVYGTPDEIERFPSSAESNPYEIWRYNNLQGGVIFVFVDRSGFGDYLLVHSTYRDELQDLDWYQRYAQKMR